MPSKTKKTILIIEDEKDVQDIYKTKFEKKGYKILLANSGAIGIDLAIHQTPDLILLDLVLPLKEGFAVLEELKNNPKTKNVPVVILSNLDQDYEIKMGKNLGAEAFLTKAETTPNEVVRVVEEILKRG
jgi:DNA-binding response OmpR family regulator